MTEAPEARRTRARAVLTALRRAIPDARCALEHRNAFELLVATILSAQCTDERVNRVTPDLFARWPDPARLARAAPGALEAVIRPTGFFRAKARSLTECARALVARHGGRVPRTMEGLVALPGVGRKTANVVLGTAFGLPAGVVVDTHVARLSARLGFSDESDPVRIERDLMALAPRASWIEFAHLLIHHGRRTCGARRPDCPGCPVRALCPSAGKAGR